jgi:hypothetical protein
MPDYNILLTIAMYLSIGLLYSNRGQRILAMQFGEAALYKVETCLQFDHDCLFICYNYLAVIHQFIDQYTEALSIYNCDSGDFDYELICLKKIVEFERK